MIEKKIKEAKTSKMWYDMHSAPRDGTAVLLLIKNSKNEIDWDKTYFFFGDERNNSDLGLTSPVLSG